MKIYMQKNNIVLLAALLILILSTSAFADSITITASVSPKAGGSISPSGRFPAGYGEDLQFRITPNMGYQIKDVTVDGVSQGAVNMYTLTNITRKHSIKARFTKQTFTVAIAQGGNVKISGVGTKKAPYGKKIKLKITPNAEDVVPILLVNGQEVDTTQSGRFYLFDLTVVGDTSVLATSAVEPTLAPQVKLMDEATVQSVLPGSPGGSVLIFNRTTPYLESLQPGDVIISGVTEATPYGLLRKVTSSAINGSQVSVGTTDATLEEVMEEGEVVVSQKLTSSDVASSVPLLEGVTPIATAPGGPLCLSLHSVLYDHDDQLSTTNDQIAIDGNACLEPTFNFALSMGWDWREGIKIKNLVFSLGISETIALELKAQYSATFRKEVPVYTYRFKPLKVWYLVFVPVLTVYVGIDGTLSAGITTGVTQDVGLTAGVSYHNNKWAPIWSFTSGYQFDKPEVYAEALAKVYAGPEFDLLLYGVAGPYADLEGYFDLDMDPLSNPWLSLYGGIRADVGVTVKIFSKKLFDTHMNVIDERKKLLELAGNQRPSITSLIANSATLFTGNTSTVTVVTSDPEHDPLTCSWSTSGGTLSATTGCGSVTWTAPGTPGKYGVSVDVSDNKLTHVPITGSVTMSVLRLPVSAATLTVKKSGTGNGTVTGTGIDCGSNCSEDYASGTSVTLTATQFPGATFTSWSGCDSTSDNTCTVIMDQSTAVTATFSMLLPPG